MTAQERGDPPAALGPEGTPGDASAALELACTPGDRPEAVELACTPGDSASLREAVEPAGTQGDLPGSLQGAAAFDFDGTLVSGDSLLPFLRLVLGRRSVPSLVAAAPPTLRAYRGGGGRNAAKAALLSRLLAGRSARLVERQGEAFAARLAERVRPEMFDRISWHRAQGHRLVLVSASLDVYLQPFGAMVGFDDVVATILEVDGGGKLTGLMLGGNVRGPEKVQRLIAVLGDEPVDLWAYGDSAGDREMLAMADHPVYMGRHGPLRRHRASSGA